MREKEGNGDKGLAVGISRDGDRVVLFVWEKGEVHFIKTYGGLGVGLVRGTWARG